MLVAYDARALNPSHRYQGVGRMIENVVCRLHNKVDLLGLAPQFPSAVPEKVINWRSPWGRLDIFTFEISPFFVKDLDLYWGTNTLLPQFVSCPKLLTFHDMLLFEFPDDQPWSRYVKRRAISSVKRATKIVAVSKSTADGLVRLFPGIGSKTEIIHHGFDQFDVAARKQAHVDSDPYFVLAGAHRPRKNLDLAIGALQRLREKGLRVRLVVTGGLHSSFRNLVEAASEFVEHVGVIPRNKLFTLLAGAQALLFPSRNEGFGFPYLEAMSAGCAVIAADIPISREIAGEAALLLPNDVFAWARGIEHFLADRSLRAELIERGKANLRRFDWGVAADQYEQVIRTLVR